jgi:sigma-B regulation protein RsbU (phosphoserine phosphatase)
MIAGGESVQRLDSTGLPLGMFQEIEFTATHVHLNAGETLMLYTDGLSEARDHALDNDDEYGVDRLAQLLHQHSALPPLELISACLNDVRTFTNSSPYADDLTLLAIRHIGSA